MQHPKLTKEKIQEIVQKVESSTKVEIIDFTLKPGAEKGDNYSGIVIACDVKAKVDSKAKEYHWMVKLSQDDPAKAAIFRGLRNEEKEIKMYSEFIPAFKRIIKERNADITFNFCDAPYTEFHEEAEKGSILLMQNLLHIGYRDAADKKKGVNIHYAKCALSEIAKFHAVGYVYFKSYPGGIEQGLKENALMARDYFVSDQDQFIKDMFGGYEGAVVQSGMELLEAVQEPGQDFVGSFKAFHEEHDCTAYNAKLYAPKANEFNTFCHGDTWFNNMLFYHETTADGAEMPTKAALLDIAMCRWGNPCTDLAYFLFLSTTPQLRKTHLDELLGHYHDTLTRCFHQLGEDPAVYPYRQLVKDYDRYRFVGLMMSLRALPMIICKKEDAIGQDEFDVDPEKFKETMERFQQQMKIAYRNEPQIKIMIGGNFLELVDTGLLKL